MFKVTIILSLVVFAVVSGGRLTLNEEDDLSNEIDTNEIDTEEINGPCEFTCTENEADEFICAFNGDTQRQFMGECRMYQHNLCFNDRKFRHAKYLISSSLTTERMFPFES